MKNCFKYSGLFIGLFCFISCSCPTKDDLKVAYVKEYSQIEKANWLLGSWQNISKDGALFEIWEKKNDSTLTGKSFFIAGKDTVSSETVSLEQRGDKLFYIPTVKDQNNGQAVKFTLTNSTSNKFVFENPQHDFPTKISYTKINSDSLVAEIWGMPNGKERTEQFPMARAK